MTPLLFCLENVVFFVLKMSVFFMSAAYLQVHFRLDLFMEANNITPDQTASKSDLGPYCLQYRLPKQTMSRQKSHDVWGKG